MIEINNNKLTFDEKHLFKSPITTFKGILDRYNQYEVNLMLHVVSDPSCRYESTVGEGRHSEDISNLSAKNRLINIIENKKINSAPKGFYSNKVKSIYPNEIKSVSFAYCNQSDADKHFKARNSEYSIIFFHDFLNMNGIQPVQYINEANDSEIRNLSFNDIHLLESYSSSYDMRWENEWRIKQSLDFSELDVAFITVPYEDYNEFLDNSLFDDYIILPSNILTSPFEFYQILHNIDVFGWGEQIKLYGEWPFDFHDFPELSEQEKEAFLKRCLDHINALSKAAIQCHYEHKYISKFSSFISSLKEEHIKSNAFINAKNVFGNTKEPNNAIRDLLIHCYEERREIQDIE